MRVVLLALMALAVFGSAIGEETATGEDRWWYAPSRKAPLYQHKYQGLVRAAARQGEDMRLPRDVLPESYVIRLLPFIELNNFTTDGYIEIVVDCKTATRNISINAAELVIDPSSIKVFDITGNVNVQVSNFWDEQESREIITIQVQNNLVVGRKYKVSMNFISFLNEDLRGFYRSSYEENGVTKYLAVSQMEAPDARRAFPCFDEPNMKAIFTITVGHKDSMSAISNMPLNRTEPIQGMPGYTWNHFEPSVKMSSYLVAMMVSDFIDVTSKPELSPDIEFKIWARSSFRNQTAYAADIGPKILNDFAFKYFNVPFPLPKQDMAAIPDFAAGAMENWGLVTYREADLLFDPVRSSASAKQRVAAIIAHELAHQWFGDLVTMDWWNVLWLNEGFASYMEYPGTNFVEPGFEMDEQIAVTDLHYVFGIDALESSRPIDFEVNTPDEINQMFDAISYEKGSCVIRMCVNFVGEPTFRRGVTRYLEKHSYGNTVSKDLWRSLQEQADAEGVILPAPIETIMDDWTRQMGFPVVNVTRLYDWTKGAYVSQERFLLRKSEGSTDTNNYRWWIPLTYTSNFSQPKVGSYWYKNSGVDGDELMVLEGSSSTSWVIFNVGQEGYYRVIYDQKNIELIHHQLMSNHKAISSRNRAQIMDDYLNLARAGMTSYVTAMDLTTYLNQERDYAPWTAASVALDYIDIMFYSLPDEAKWKTYMTSLVTPLYGSVGYIQNQTDAHLKIYTRSQAVSWECSKLSMADCVNNAKSDYKKWMDDATKELSPNLRRLISCTAIANGGRAEWEFGYNKYMTLTLVNEKIELLRATTCTVDVAILNEMLNMMINNQSGIRLQDANTVFSNIAANPVGHQVALDFMTNKWNDIYNYFGSYQGFGGSTMARLFRSLCNRVNTQAKLTQLRKLRDDHMDVLGSAKTVSQGMEVAEANVLWVGKYYVSIVNWLKTKTDPPVPPTTPEPSSATSNQHVYYFATVAAVVVGRWMLQSLLNIFA